MKLKDYIYKTMLEIARTTKFSETEVTFDICVYPTRIYIEGKGFVEDIMVSENQDTGNRITFSCRINDFKIEMPKEIKFTFTGTEA